MSYFALPLGIFLLDQGAKNWIEKRKKGSLPKEIFGERILLRKSHNQGAAFGILKERPGLVQWLSGALWAALAGSWLYLLGKKGEPPVRLGMACLVGGAASNVYDRLKRGYVVDYFSFLVKWKKLRSVVFNLGDLFIFLGSLLVILWNLRRKS